MATTTTTTERPRIGPRRRSITGRRASRLLALRLLALLLAISLGAAACGSSDSDSSSVGDTSPTVAGDGAGTAETNSGSAAVVTPADGERVRLGAGVLAKTLDADSQAKSARFTGTMTLTGDMGTGPSGPVSISFEGAFDLAAEATSMAMDMSGMTDALLDDEPSMAGMGDLFSEPIRIITIGEDSWMQWGFFSMMGVSADQWVQLDPEDAGNLTSDMGAGGMGDPTQLLRQLEDADARIKKLGIETVRGVETTHIRAVVDIDSMAETLSPEDRAEFEETFSAGGLSEMPIDFWIGEDGLIYRWSMELDTSAMGDAEGLGSVSIVYEIYDYGQDVGIVAPDPAKVVDGSTLGF